MGLTDSSGRLFALREEAPKWMKDEGQIEKLEDLVTTFAAGGNNEGPSEHRGDHMGSKAGVSREVGAAVSSLVPSTRLTADDSPTGPPL